MEDVPESQYTGRFIVVFSEADTAKAIGCLHDCAGLRVATSSDFESRVVEAPGDDDYALYFESLGIAVVSARDDPMAQLRPAVASGSRVVPERFIYTSGMLSLNPPYLEGFRDGVNTTIEHMLGAAPKAPHAEAARGLVIASSSFTWNLERVGLPASNFAGRGVKVAVLDTGYDIDHPDFRGRAVRAHSFVPGSSVQDMNGHGTHCLGTACGMATPASSGPRYGCASEAEILVAKVVADDGHGKEEWTLNGINWALEQGADIVSMSLETRFNPADPFLPQYEAAGRRALDAGRLIIAAAGNHSARPLLVRPVTSPAAAPSIMAVGAIGPDGSVAPFSCAGGPEGEVDVVAPGVGIESAAPMPRARTTANGTSMAAPLVAGIAALHKERDPSLRGEALWASITSAVDNLDLPAMDVGAGCALAP